MLSLNTLAKIIVCFQLSNR